MKRIIECLIVALMFLGSFAFADWDGSSSKPKNTREIDGKIFYEISNPEELAWFAEQVNSGKTTINAVLANDIKFMDDTNKTSSVNWTPIGKDSTVMFNGIFDGLGYTIYGLYCSNGKTRFAGIFGVTDRESMIKNIKSAKSLINATNGVFWNGGIIGLNNGTIVGCTNSGLINRNGYANYNAGGIVGTNLGVVIDCINIGSIFWGAGIVHYNKGSVINCTNKGSVWGAGIVFYNDGSVINCTNNGIISGSSDVLAAGIVTFNDGSVISCTNNGMISDSSSSGNGGGGIIAHNDGFVSRCTNNGKVMLFSSSQFSYAGGIVGLQGKGVIANCRNFGQVYANNPGGLVGGIASDSAALYNSYSTVVGVCGIRSSCFYRKIVNCFYNSDNSTENKYDSVDVGIIGLSSADMQSDRFAWILNTTNGTDTNSGIWGREQIGYPIYADSTHNPVNSMYYKPIYKVIFKVNLISLVRYSNFQGLVDFPEAPEIPWKMFLGWFDENGDKVSPETIFTKERTLTAVYSDLSGLGSKDRLAPTWSVTASGRNFQIHVAPVGKSYALFDLQGKVLAKGRVESSEMTLSASRAGSYIIRVGERSVRMNAK